MYSKPRDLTRFLARAELLLSDHLATTTRDRLAELTREDEIALLEDMLRMNHMSEGFLDRMAAEYEAHPWKGTNESRNGAMTPALVVAARWRRSIETGRLWAIDVERRLTELRSAG